MAQNRKRKLLKGEVVVQEEDGTKRIRRPKEQKPKYKRVNHTKALLQSHFQCVEFYMQGFSKTECLIKAGFAKATARTSVWRVFGREDVQREIEKRRYALKSRSNQMIDRIQDELAKIAFFNIGTVVRITDEGDLIMDFDEATLDELAAIGEVTVESYKDGQGPHAPMVKRVKVKPYDKKAALDSLARIHGLFKDSLLIDDAGSLEKRLQAGRARIGKKQLSDPSVIEGEFEEVET